MLWWNLFNFEYLQSVLERICFFLIYCNTSVECRRATYSRKRSDRTVPSIGWPLSERPIAAQCLRGRGGKILKIIRKKHNFSWTPCIYNYAGMLIAWFLCLPQVRDLCVCLGWWYFQTRRISFLLKVSEIVYVYIHMYMYTYTYTHTFLQITLNWK